MTKRTGPRYAIIPADAITDKRLIGKDDLKVLALLGRHIDAKGWCTRTQGRMADELEIARGALQRSLGRLVDAGFVEVRHEKRRDGGQAANSYRVVLDDAARADQLDLFFEGGDDAARSPRSEKAPPATARAATPASRMRHPLPHPDEAPPASPERGTHKERPLQGTSPCDSATAAPPPVTPANDDQSKLHRLAAALRKVAGEAINTAAPKFIQLSEPLGWLDGGCDLDLDVLPTVRALCANRRGRPIQSWAYFTAAVQEARDRRVAASRPMQASGSGPPAGVMTIIEPNDRGSGHGHQHRSSAEQRSAGFGALAAAFARKQGRHSGEGDQ